MIYGQGGTTTGYNTHYVGTDGCFSMLLASTRPTNKLLALQKDVFDISKVTVVGSPTITSDGVVSNLSTSNFVRTENINLGNASSWQCEIEYTYTQPNTSISNGNQRIFAYGNNQFILQINSSNRIIIVLSNSSSGDIANTTLTNTLTAGQTYKVKFVFTGLEYALYIDGVKIWSLSSTTKIGNAPRLYFFCGETYAPSLGTQDLTAVKIYVDGQLVFQPTKPTYLLERRKPKVWNKGQFTIVGNPSITDDGVASGLSNNDYIVPTSLTLEQLKGKSWSYSFKCTIPDTSASSKYIISFANNLFPSLVGGIKFEGYGIYLGGKYGTTEDSTGELWKLIGTYSRPADVGKEVLITVSFNIETGEYNAKAILDNKELNMTPYIPPTANKELYYINTNSSSKAFRVLVGNDKFYLKSIKIYTDNTLVFDGGADTYVYDPSKFAVAGSPTITEYGVASGFSSTNRILITNVPTFDKPFKVEFKIKTGDLTSGQSTFYSNGGSYYNAISIYGGTSPRFQVSLKFSDGVEKGLIVTGPNSYTDYKGYFGWTGEEYILHIDGLGESKYTSSLLISTSSSTQIKLGCLATNELPFTGSINLPLFSITVDGKEVFTGAKEKFCMLRR